jgi:hypothetical protein
MTLAALLDWRAVAVLAAAQQQVYGPVTFHEMKHAQTD